MRSFLKSATLLALAMLVAAPLSAAEDGAKKKKDKGANRAVTQAFALPDTITLTDEQKTKLAEVKKEFEGKLTEVVKKQAEILTSEQKTAREAAVKSAKAAGKTGKDAKAEVEAALKLTDEQKKEQAEVGKELRAVTGQIKEKISSFLTADQKALIKDKKKKKDA